MPHHLGLQATNWDRTLHHWSQIHRSESISSRRYTIYLSPTWDPTPGQDQVSRPRCTLHHHLFEDNEGALALARCPKMRPRTKHLCLKYHHFREQHVRRGLVIPEPIDTKEQTGGIFTKALPKDQFQYVRRKLCGWWILQHPWYFYDSLSGFLPEELGILENILPSSLHHFPIISVFHAYTCFCVLTIYYFYLQEKWTVESTLFVAIKILDRQQIWEREHRIEMKSPESLLACMHSFSSAT